MKHCRDENLYCINMPSELDLNYDDFYDENHLNPTGSKKVSTYLFKRLRFTTLTSFLMFSTFHIFFSFAYTFFEHQQNFVV